MGNLGLYVETAKKRSREERELFEERAGIMELDGGLSREEAELGALREILTAGRE
jgi:hypothetical protein